MLTIGGLGFMVIQSCNDFEPQVNIIKLNVKHISRSGVDTSTTNIDTTSTTK